ncbi:hypothetical protein HAX54_032526, partial [Datura stramonium]|nr:hypothetical protein [Datura stramonium]
MEDLNSKRAAKDMLLTGEMRIRTCEMQVERSCYCLAPTFSGLAPDKCRSNS